jgi:hypothetical protein
MLTVIEHDVKGRFSDVKSSLIFDFGAPHLVLNRQDIFQCWGLELDGHMLISNVTFVLSLPRNLRRLLRNHRRQRSRTIKVESRKWPEPWFI